MSQPFDARKSLTALEQHNTIVALIEILRKAEEQLKQLRTAEGSLIGKLVTQTEAGKGKRFSISAPTWSVSTMCFVASGLASG